ncbi:hypothetical protein B0H17DRAFT_1134221 [Mycena rosella]|uniref:Uncharacterized protein n=1 Tax=Mycena rosella TaxID=1033263 RepID=A0AAD7GEG9_MYCRO|nr:hypothetical protein B0H17DRAFT_1134221 [Mycena rosella]
MGPRYLLCLLIRLGVLVIAFSQFLCSAVVTVLLSYILVLDSAQDNDSVKIPSRTRNTVVVLAVVCGLVALISLTGFRSTKRFIGAVRKTHSHFALFLRLLRFFLMMQIVTVIAYFVLYFADKDQFRKLCIENLNHGLTNERQATETCNASSKLSLWVMIVSAVVPILSQAYGVHIVSAYARKLGEEESYREYPLVSGPGYVVIGGEEARPLRHKVADSYVDTV